LSDARNKNAGRDEVFYNPSQVFNRDLSSLVIRAYHQILCEEKKNNDEKLNILELFGASGLRSCRYAKEMNDMINMVVCNDMDFNATKHTLQNASKNEVIDKVYATCADATSLCNGGNGHLLDMIHKQYDLRVIKQLKDWGTQRTKYIEDINPEEQRKDTFRKPFDQTLMDLPFNVVDIDPYGSAAPFLDAAVKKIANGGLLCVTSTDMQVLASGTYPETIFTKYGGMQLTHPNCPWIHEMSLRILMHTLNLTCAKYGLYAHPLLCITVDFYIRIFVQIRRSPLSVKFVGCLSASGIYCSKCESHSIIPMVKSSPSIHTDENEFFATEPKEDQKGFAPLLGKVIEEKFGSKFRFRTPTCEMTALTNGKCTVCDGENRPHFFGPFYAGQLYDQRFVEIVRKLASNEEDTLPAHIIMGDRINGMLSAMLDELQSVPLYYDHARICSHFKCPTIPSRIIRRALKRLGYKVSQQHRDPAALKTNAPVLIVHDLIRKWNIKVAADTEGKEGKTNKEFDEFLKKEIVTVMEDDIFKKRDGDEEDVDRKKTKKIARYKENPGPNWGPMQKAKRAKTDDEPAVAAAAAETTTNPLL